MPKNVIPGLRAVQRPLVNAHVEVVAPERIGHVGDLPPRLAAEHRRVVLHSARYVLGTREGLAYRPGLQEEPAQVLLPVGLGCLGGRIPIVDAKETAVIRRLEQHLQGLIVLHAHPVRHRPVVAPQNAHIPTVRPAKLALLAQVQRRSVDAPPPGRLHHFHRQPVRPVRVPPMLLTGGLRRRGRGPVGGQTHHGRAESEKAP
jgi:hypothetical protein